MSEHHFDYVVIGGGSGGYAAARTARETLDRVAIIDSAERLGGLCILRGCMPSKTIIYAAEVFHLAKKSTPFGIQLENLSIDLKTLHSRKKAMVSEFAEYRQEQLQSDRFTLFRNHARFIAPNCVELDNGDTVTAKHFMVATGSSVSVPPIAGLADVPFWTSDDVLDLDFIPKKVIVLGGGIVACELAQFLCRIGTEVIQIQRSEYILSLMSNKVSEELAMVLRREGVQLFTKTETKQIGYDSREFSVTFMHDGSERTVTAPHLVNALGRNPNTKSLDLDAAAVEVKDSGAIRVDEHQMTSNQHVYACGDVTGPHELVHIAVMQGELAARHATGQRFDAIDYKALLIALFTDPQVAYVGQTEKQLSDEGVDFVAADYPFDDHGKSILMEAKDGFVRVIADRSSGHVLAAECVGKDASELIHGMAIAITLRATVFDLLKVHWYHPTLSEIWTYPLEDIAEEIRSADR